MTGEAESPSIELPVAPLADARSAIAPGRWWMAASDLLNPILVKEARQALKSKQFLVTFSLLLLGSWVATIVGVAAVGPEIYYGSQGPTMFFWYYLILAFALLVIVPFGAFRSLAGEQEDRTYELMSITTLGPRQIVSGKLGSAVVQMLVYLSAITPCLAFTYMLRGIDLPTILCILFYTVLGSLALSMAALLLGTLTAEKHWQVVLSVVIIVGLLVAFGFSCGITANLLSAPAIAVSEVEFWQFNAAFVSGYLGYLMLCFYAAAAQITFASDNRATRLRVTMLALHLLAAGWMCWTCAGPAKGDPSVMAAFVTMAALHWFAMGAMMTGETGELSPRVKRRLPKSSLGRMFLTWFNPGPCTGYVFAVCGMLAAVLTVLGMFTALEVVKWWPSTGRWPGVSEGGTPLAVMATSYVTAYLGVGLLLIRFLWRFARCRVLLALLIQVLLVLLGTGVPLIVQGLMPQRRGSGYSLLHATNPFWSSSQTWGSFRSPGLSSDAAALLTVVPVVAIVVFLLNLPAIAREVCHVRIERPKRVAEEDAALLAAKHPPQPVHISPWD